MNNEIVHTKIRKTAMPRTGRTLDAISNSPSGSGSVNSPTSGGVISDISILEGTAITIEKSGTSYTISHKDTSSAESVIKEAKKAIAGIGIDDLGHVTEIERCDILVLEDLDKRYLFKQINDTAHGIITFDKKIGSSIYLDGMDGKGWEITDTGAATLGSACVRSDIYIGGKFGSVSYASGWSGWGTEIDIPTASATFDFLTVRKSMKVYELVYSQIYGLGGSVLISDLNKILYVETCQGFYRCYMDSMDSTMRMNLRKDDLVRMQRNLGINIRYFFGEVLNVTAEYFDLRITEGEDFPQLGDVVFRMGNKTDKKRQGVIYLTSNDDHAPYVDILDGITDASMFEKVKVRLGNLRGIRTKKGIQLDKYGIYAKGGVFEDSDIYLPDGTTVEQQFIIMNGKFESTIEGIRNDMSLESGNILRNSSFGRDTNYWTTSNTVHFINVGGGDYLWMDGSFYVEKTNVADIYRDGSKNVLRVRNASITQMNNLLSGDRPEGIYSIAFYYKVLLPGTLSVGFDGQDLYSSLQLTSTGDFQKFAKYGKWDGKGDFKIAYTGEILIYGVSLFNDRLADAQIKLQTQIDQTSEYIKLLATKEYVDKETGAIYVHYDSKLEITAEQMSGISTKVEGLISESAGWITRAEGVTLFAKKTMETGKEIVSAINVGTDNILIYGSRVNLVGAVTFSSFNSSLQGTINGKADSSSLGSLAYSDEISTYDLSYSLSQTIANKLDPSALTPYAKKGQIGKSDFVSNLQTEINGAMQKETYIVGGYIKTSFLDVDNIYATSINAVRGYVAGFNISGNSLTNGPSFSNDASIIFRNDSHGTFAGIGGNVLPASSGARAVARFENHDNSDQWNLDKNFALIVSSKNASYDRNHAIAMLSGFISGFAIKPLQITTSTTLNHEDAYVSCYNKSDISVYLPPNPTPGKLVFVRRVNSYEVTVQGNGKSIFFNGAVSGISIDEQSKTGMFFYDGQYWMFNAIKW